MKNCCNLFVLLKLYYCELRLLQGVCKILNLDYYRVFKKISNLDCYRVFAKFCTTYDIDSVHCVLLVVTSLINLCFPRDPNVVFIH